MPGEAATQHNLATGAGDFSLATMLIIGAVGQQ